MDKIQVNHKIHFLALEDLELMVVQAWLIWNQRNRVIHGGKFYEPSWLNKRAMEYLEDYRATQNQFDADQVQQPSRDSWKPPPPSVYKLNFDAAVFSGLDRFGFGAVIKKDKGEVMAAMSAKGPSVFCSEEAELLACRKAIKLATDVGFSKFIVEGDNSTVMHAISSPNEDESLMGNVVGDIRQMLRGLHWVNVEFTRRRGHKVAHVLAQYAKNIIDDMYWMEYLPPLAREALYQDANVIG